jgi:hypothetical protein
MTLNDALPFIALYAGILCLKLAWTLYQHHPVTLSPPKEEPEPMIITVTLTPEEVADAVADWLNKQDDALAVSVEARDCKPIIEPISHPDAGKPIYRFEGFEVTTVQ